MNYRPNKAYGGLVGLILGLLIFGFSLWGIDFALDADDRALRLLLLIPTFLFFAIYSYLLIGAFYLRYKLDDAGLVIAWGLHRKRIAWDQIDELIQVKGRANLFPFLAISWPGYLFGLYSAKGLGSVRMYASDISQGFIYIKTKHGFFGISPADSSILDYLVEKTGRQIQTVEVDKIPHEVQGEIMHKDRFFNLYVKLNLIFLAVFALYIGIFFPGSDAPRFIILLLVLALALFIFNLSNARRLYQFSSQGASITLLVGLAVTGIFVILSLASISL